MAGKARWAELSQNGYVAFSVWNGNFSVNPCSGGCTPQQSTA